MLSGGPVNKEQWLDKVSQITPAVVKLEIESCSGSGSGSGFLIKNWLVTNRHVMQEASRATFRNQGARHKIATWFESAVDDIAIVPLGYTPKEMLTLSASDPVPGDLVAAAGYPWGGPIVSEFGRILGEDHSASSSSATFIIQSNLDIHPGNSGGPLLDTSGYVVGVMFAIDTQSNASLSVPVSRLRDILNISSKKATHLAKCR